MLTEFYMIALPGFWPACANLSQGEKSGSLPKLGFSHILNETRRTLDFQRALLFRPDQWRSQDFPVGVTLSGSFPAPWTQKRHAQNWALMHRLPEFQSWVWYVFLIALNIYDWKGTPAYALADAFIQAQISYLWFSSLLYYVGPAPISNFHPSFFENTFIEFHEKFTVALYSNQILRKT